MDGGNGAYVKMMHNTCSSLAGSRINNAVGTYFGGPRFKSRPVTSFPINKLSIVSMKRRLLAIRWVTNRIFTFALLSILRLLISLISFRKFQNVMKNSEH
jgi:hypothetical protein